MLKEHVMPSRNVPAISGHNPVHYTHEMPDNDSMTMKEEEPVAVDDDDEESLLEEMVPRNGTEDNHHSMPEYPLHMQPSPIEEFVQICRSCLSTDRTNLVSAFDDRLADIFLQFTSVSINENEGISTMICVDCKSRLLEIHFFRDTCVTNTQILFHRYQKCYGTVPGGGAHRDQSHHEYGYNPQVIPSASHYNRYDMGADDPEDLLMPQKEEMEVAVPKPSRPRGRPPKRPPTPPKPVISPPKLKKTQKIATMKKRFKCKFCRKEYNSRPGYEMHLVSVSQ